MKKQLITLICNGFNPAITAITLPPMRAYAEKIDAEFSIIDTPVFNQPSMTYEKFQLYELSKGYDWSIFLDADALVHPDTPDWTESITKEVVLFHGLDMSLNRFRATDYTRRSKLLMGACTWNVTCSDWCRDLWHPLQDMTWDECMANIFPTIMELNSGVCDKRHLIDDYLLTQNIARYGLRTQTIMELCRQFGHPTAYYHHLYACSEEFKIKSLQERLKEWQESPTIEQQIAKAKEEEAKAKVKQDEKVGVPLMEHTAKSGNLCRGGLTGEMEYTGVGQNQVACYPIGGTPPSQIKEVGRMIVDAPPKNGQNDAPDLTETGFPYSMPGSPWDRNGNRAM